jgi:hypothetical protein
MTAVVIVSKIVVSHVASAGFVEKYTLVLGRAKVRDAICFEKR